MSLRKPSATIINIAQADRRQSGSRTPHANNGSPKAQEYQNMVRHILGKINKRRRPPTALVHIAEQCRSINSTEVFDNEDLVDLLIQLRTALSLCQKSGVGDQVLSQRDRDDSPISSQQTSPLPSPRSPDPEGGSSFQSPVIASVSIFDKIIAMLNDLILNDCRYKSSNPKPSRPPYMLQYLVIDISIVLVTICNDIHSLNVIGTCMLPAFDVFPEGTLLSKLLGFFIDILIPNIMDREEDTPSRSSHEKPRHPLAPTINISGPETSTSDRNRENHLTIDTHLSLSHASVSLRSPRDDLRRDDDSAQYTALFPPLLYFMARYLAPYLSYLNNGACDSLSQNITTRSHSLYNFHRALRFMIQKKPDFYLDILQVIAFGTSDVKYRACQILFHYYDISAGHVVVADPLPVLGYEEEYAELEKLKERQDYEEARQQEQQQQQQQLPHTVDPPILNAMMTGSSGSLNVAGINRKYRPGPTATGSASQLPRQQSVDDMDKRLSSQKRHVLYPHIFTDHSKYQAEELSVQTQRLSTGIQTLGVTVHDDMNGAYCSECFKLIKGYGLRCYRCKFSVHYGCSASDDQDIMLYVKEGGIQKVVSPQFCHIPPLPRADVFYASKTSGNYSLSVINAFGHEFHLINLFTLILCAVCQLPLWGISLQGYRCCICNKFVHASCLSASIQQNGFRRDHPDIQTCQPYKPLRESDTRITYTSLCTGLQDFYGDLLPSKEEDLHGRGFEEVGTILSTLMLQDNILQCGITSGCLLVSHENEDPLQSDDHDDASHGPRHCPLLQRGIDCCIAYLASGNCHASTFLSNFYADRLYNLEGSVLSKEEYLAHLAAMMKSMATCRSDREYGAVIKASSHVPGKSQGFLRLERVQHDNRPQSSRYDVSSFDLPRETMDKENMISWMVETLGFKSIGAAKILIQHMRNLGLFENLDGTHVLFGNDQLKAALGTTIPSGNKCVFPLPFAIDYSPNVELLLNTIEACLSDIDISINECGLLLLTRRCWPDPFMSFYTSIRLIESILLWIFQEDEKLTALQAGYIANKQALPGVRTNRWTQVAQNVLLSRMKGGGGPSSSGDRHRQSVSFANATGLSSGAGIVYVTTRNALRDRYIVRWMKTLHDIDPDAYASMLHDMLERIVEGKREEPSIPGWVEKEDRQKSAVQRFEEFLGYLLKLKACGITFTAMDPILQRWFDKTHAEFQMEGILEEKEPVEIRSLAKLCSSRVSISKGSPDPSKITTDMSGQTFDVVTSLFTTGDTESIERGIRWLTLIMHAGTGVPYNILAKIARLLVASQVPIDVMAEFTKLLWFQAVNILNINVSRAGIIDVIGYLNEIALDTLHAKGDKYSYTAEELECVQKFIRYSAALTCFSYNCPLANITNLDLVPYFGDHIAQLSQNKRATMHPDSAQTMNVDNSTPIIRCMLAYLKMDELNIKQHIIKMFYALVNWGFGISDKNDFVEKCMEPLVAAVWEMLPPSYDAMSDITLNLLMKLMNVDPKYFHACVYQVFDNKDWEVRFLGLDNLYGLFTKMDAAFQTKWLPMLAHLGPVFSYFVGSLFDREEYVRSKAFAMIRTFGTLHLRSAFRCWEAYFLTATDTQRLPVVKLMLRLNALFPDWQVIQWESLLEALESKQGKSSDTQSIDILEQYMRPGGSSKQETETQDEEADLQQLAESENSKIFMLVLAMQMLANHLAINTVQMSRLKYVFVSLMGFEDCQRYSVSGEWHVSFGNMSFDPSLPAQSAFVTACSRSLKKVMDSFAPLPAETVASMAPEVLERNRVELAENSSPGVHFIDVVVKLFNSGIDLTTLNHMTLKIWLETILIVVYKHNILEHEIEQGIVSCMKHIIELLTKDISEENKLLILEILKYLLRRSDHLTAMVLSKQIMALGKLLTKLGSQPSDPVFLKAKEFLKSAFLRFAVAGLFVLMFKNQTVSDSNNRDVDLFFVLKTVIDPKDIVPEEDTQEVVYLRHQPIRDVLDKLMKQQMERRAFSTVLYNMCRYVETVHSHPYSEFILNDYAVFLNSLAKHTAGWRRSDWDINPIFTMSAILLREHPYHFAILLPQILAIFKYGLQNCIIRPESVAKLLYAYSTLQSIPGVQPENAFMQIILEEVKSTLGSRGRLHKDTFLTLIELILWDTSPEYMDWFCAAEGQHSYHHQRYFEQGLPSLLEPLTYFVKTPPVTQLFTKTEYKTYCAVSKLLAIMCVQSETALSKILDLQKTDELRPTLRFFNWFLLAVLREKASVILLEQLLSIEDTIRELVLQALHSIPVGFDRIDDSFAYNASGELLAQSFVLIKAWTLLGQPHKSSFWMSIWPGIRRLLDSVDPAMLGVAGSNGAFLWKHFLSLVQFLFACRSDAVLVNAYEWSLFLNILLEQESMDAEKPGLEDLVKQAAAVRDMFTIPSIQVPTNVLVDQLFLELRDIMRLQSETVLLQSSSGVSKAFLPTVSADL